MTAVPRNELEWCTEGEAKDARLKEARERAAYIANKD
jgi:hypothetical protein